MASYGQLAMTEPSGCAAICAAANVGCEGGAVTGAHDADVTFHCNCAAIDGDDVGEVGDDCEQPTASNNDKQHNARFTTSSLVRRNCKAAKAAHAAPAAF